MRRATALRLSNLRASAWFTAILAWPSLALIVLLSLFILYMTFVPDLPFKPGFTLDHWTSLTGGKYLFTKVLPNTAIVGFGTVAVSLIFAIPIAWLLNRTTI